MRSHSFETLGVPRKTTGTGSQKPKVKTHNSFNHIYVNNLSFLNG